LEQPGGCRWADALQLFRRHDISNEQRRACRSGFDFASEREHRGGLRDEVPRDLPGRRRQSAGGDHLCSRLASWGDSTFGDSGADQRSEGAEWFQDPASHTQSDPDTQTDAHAHSHGNPDPHTNSNGNTYADTNGNADPNTYSHTNSNADPNSDTYSHTDCNADPNPDTYSHTNCNADANRDTNSNPDGNPDSDANTGTISAIDSEDMTSTSWTRTKTYLFGQSPRSCLNRFGVYSLPRILPPTNLANPTRAHNLIGFRGSSRENYREEIAAIVSKPWQHLASPAFR
jgi:hypothetical protein